MTMMMMMRCSSKGLSKRRVCIVSVVGLMIGSLLAIPLVVELILPEESRGLNESSGKIKSSVFPKEIRSTAFAKKLLQSIDKRFNDRIGTSCSRDDIVIYQGSTTPLPNGTPSYTVQILNTCASGCSISNIHVSCGWFSSVRLIDPRIFRRILYDDCLVNDGEALGSGEIISFQYANSFRYPLSVTSANCS